VALVDRNGQVACHTGSRTRPWAGHQVGDGFAALGNVLKGEPVAAAMADAFRASTSDDLAERLMVAIEAGRRAGGQQGLDGPLPERSAHLLVHGADEHPAIDLRVDSHPDAVTELRRLVDEFRPSVCSAAYTSRHPCHPASPAAVPKIYGARRVYPQATAIPPVSDRVGSRPDLPAESQGSDGMTVTYWRHPPSLRQPAGPTPSAAQACAAGLARFRGMGQRTTRAIPACPTGASIAKAGSTLARPSVAARAAKNPPDKQWRRGFVLASPGDG
jgi:hypothetical protein